ncbi:uncharacterized protein LOC128671146 isoform X2 [Plodia interpunctella]|uniref:uncharacterized protein LOC128671146 isoform X2 n=1 Tax=Plodia interpunctella TaxID=58824 RepID=UPI002368C2F5|nr:uncharacterized protein LOC128671146 isoform X2 [Plodia interpunctella]
MLCPAISLCIMFIMFFREVLSFEVVLLNGSVTIVNFDKACESCGYKIGDPIGTEEDIFTTSIATTSREVNSLGEVLEAFCPYIGYHRNEDTSKANSTAAEILVVRGPEESSKLKNGSKPFKIETKSTINYETSEDKNITDSEIKPAIIPLLYITTNTTNKMIESEPTDKSKETTPYKIVDISFIVQNATESITPALELASENATKNKNGTAIPDIFPSDTVTTTVGETITTRMEKSLGMKLKVVENVTESMNIESDSASRHITFPPEISPISKNFTISTILPHSESSTRPMERTTNTKPKFLIENVTELITLKIDTNITNEIKLESTTEISKKEVAISEDSDSKSSTGYYDKETSTIKLLFETLNTESILVLPIDMIDKTSVNPINSKNKDIMENVTSTTISIDPTTKIESNVQEVTKSKYDATIGNKATVTPVIEYIVTVYENNTITESDHDVDLTIDYLKHDPKSVDERRIVIVILFVSILLAMIVIWTSKVLYRKHKGEYVLPRNARNENIELGDNSI